MDKDGFDKQMCRITLKNGTNFLCYWNGKTYHGDTIYAHPCISDDYCDVDYRIRTRVLHSESIRFIKKLNIVTDEDSKRRVKVRNNKKQVIKKSKKKEVKKAASENEIRKEVKKPQTRWNCLEF